MKDSHTAPQVLREELPVQRFVCDTLGQAVVEGEVALPGGLREETRVLCTQALAVLEHANVENARVGVDGRVTFHVLYTQGDPTRVSTLEAAADFTHPIDIPGAQPGMTALVSLSPEHVEASAQGGRLHLMAILRVHARVLTDEPVSVVTGVQDVDGLMLRTETVRVLRPGCQGAQDVLIRDECELPAALQINDTLYATAIATVHEVMGGEERAAVTGTIDLEVTHVSSMPSRPVVITRHSIPFDETLALSGERGDGLCCSAVVRDVAVLSQEAGDDGERTLRAEVLLGLQVQSARTKDVCLLLDAYTTQGDALALETQSVRRVCAHRQIRTAESGRLTLLLDGQPPVRTPLKAVLTPIITDLTPQSGRLNVEGMMDVTLLYMTDDDPSPRTWHTEEPFRMTFACDPSLPESIILTPGMVDVTPVTSDRVEVKYILHLDCQDVQLAPEQMVTQVTACPAGEREPGMVVYFSQPGETLWDIAKRYRVNAEAIKRMNPTISEEGAAQVQRVLMWSR
ncbi:MAG: DUF3794 domain-containing protein [Clostridia bacterium]|nr:DUF3794 domain-containing protein [Clostridia bacterium]